MTAPRTSSTIRRPATVEDLLAACGGDVFVRCEARATAAGDLVGPAWASPAAVVFSRRGHGAGPQRLTAIGPPQDAAGLLLLAIRELGAPPAAITVPRSAVALLPEPLRPPQTEDWDWFWTSAAPPYQPGEERIGELPAGTDEEIRALLHAASPRYSAEPGASYVRRWCGLRSAQGELVGCGALVEYVPGVPHLASIATLPAWRGRGWGAATTAWLTRAALAQAGICTLGMYADNEVARRLYRRLGYADSHHFTSGQLAAP